MNESQTPRGRSDGALLCARLQPLVIETRYIGHLTVKLIDETQVRFKQILGESPTPFWLADATGITTFEPRIGIAGAHWISDFKAHGGQLLVVVVASTALRMVGSTAGFATGIRVKMAETREQGLALIADAVREGPRPAGYPKG